MPIAESRGWDKPFIGAILAGEFTAGSIEQLKSLGFRLLHVPHSTIVDAFSFAGIDARFDETIPDEEFQRRVDRIEAMDRLEIQELHHRLVEDCKPLIDDFLGELADALDRMVDSVTILPLSGEEHVFESLSDAERFVDGFYSERNLGPFQKYEAIVKYSNGDRIEGSFVDKKGLKRFLSHVGG